MELKQQYIIYPDPSTKSKQEFKNKKGDFPLAEKQAERILTLPINQYLKKSEIFYICDLINKFYS